MPPNIQAESGSLDFSSMQTAHMGSRPVLSLGLLSLSSAVSLPWTSVAPKWFPAPFLSPPPQRTCHTAATHRSDYHTSPRTPAFCAAATVPPPARPPGLHALAWVSPPAPALTLSSHLLQEQGSILSMFPQTRQILLVLRASVHCFSLFLGQRLSPAPPTHPTHHMTRPPRHPSMSLHPHDRLREALPCSCPHRTDSQPLLRYRQGTVHKPPFLHLSICLSVLLVSTLAGEPPTRLGCISKIQSESLASELVFNENWLNE